jgi:hypothetical protein
MNAVTIELEREKETKRTIRFKETGDGDRLGMIYVPKATMSALGDPTILAITLAAAA